MSKISRSLKNKDRKRKQNAVSRLERMTELKRQIKLYKTAIVSRKKDVETLHHNWWWAKLDLEHSIDTLANYEQELSELQIIETNERNKS